MPRTDCEDAPKRTFAAVADPGRPLERTAQARTGRGATCGRPSRAATPYHDPGELLSRSWCRFIAILGVERGLAPPLGTDCHDLGPATPVRHSSGAGGGKRPISRAREASKPRLQAFPRVKRRLPQSPLSCDHLSRFDDAVRRTGGGAAPRFAVVSLAARPWLAYDFAPVVLGRLP